MNASRFMGALSAVFCIGLVFGLQGCASSEKTDTPPADAAATTAAGEASAKATVDGAAAASTDAATAAQGTESCPMMKDGKDGKCPMAKGGDCSACKAAGYHANCNHKKAAKCKAGGESCSKCESCAHAEMEKPKKQ